MTERIAIIGSGISGLTSAYLLNKKYDVCVFERDDRIGGHTHTVKVHDRGVERMIDTGFIVFNERTYPLFQALMQQIGVGELPTEMSFSVHNERTGIEYNGHSVSSLFAQKRNLLRPKFWAFLFSIMRFNKLCKTLDLDAHNDLTLGDFLAREGFDDFFCNHYILPMGAAIWSASLTDMRSFDLAFFVRFFRHHGLLEITNRPQWYVIPGGSFSYLEPLTQSFKDKIVTNANIRHVRRTQSGALLEMADGTVQHFDKVVFACHSDQVLELLGEQATIDEYRVLRALPYRDNDVVLHRDTSLLPKRKAAWAAWNYRLTDDRVRPAAVSYSMNILQRLPSDASEYIVSLNQSEMIDPDLIEQQFNYAHPSFTRHGIQAQLARGEINGQLNTYFVGAYWYNGFHEDGVRSAVDVGELLGVSL